MNRFPPSNTDGGSADKLQCLRRGRSTDFVETMHL